MLIGQELDQLRLWAENQGLSIYASGGEHTWSVSVLAGGDLGTVPGIGARLVELWISLKRIAIHLVGTRDTMKHGLLLRQNAVLHNVILMLV